MGLFSKKPKEPEYDAADCERFLDFAEAFRIKLEQRGYKLDKWKR